MSSPTKSDVPVPTSNSLKDIIDWLKLGDVVIIHVGDCGHIYHIDGLQFNRKIFVDVSAMPSLLDEGEWPDFINMYTKATELNDSNVKCSGETYHFSLPSLNKY